MSLQVPQELISRVGAGMAVTRDEFIHVVESSLPLAWSVFVSLAERKRTGEPGVVMHAPEFMEDAQRGQLLRALASNPIRSAINEHFGMVFAFQNCHITAVFLPEEVESEMYRRFTSREAQIAAQSPGMVHC
jgi:hypothetical protein